ncbi:glycosyltransferase family 4 protein [Microbacterium esteraromaticum]|uniref:Glycosyltransferase family 4 protein n=1 Tax=Microbacterium esteraromaticum TaxID=57043 RepID=A0A7D7W9K6_9MICO|nr:glycosyltransferase [Microbacterium esteraromaticum]QMU97716.1 glycosyltransferase family 4 protein [Microbacterium esteraromaticum]
MNVQLRVVLDQVGGDADQTRAGFALAEGLIRTAPRGCVVSAITPSGTEVTTPGLHEIRTLPLARRELAAAWQMGIPAGVGGGLIHSPSLLAPLVRHDRVHDHDQTTVTLWDLCAWESPDALSKSSVVWQRSMLKRAIKHADAIVVPSHAMAERLGEIVPVGDRIRVIAGAAPIGFGEPDDAAALRADLQLPERYVVLIGDAASLADGFRAAAHADIDAVVLDAEEGAEPALADLAAAAGLPERRAHIRGALDDATRAAALAGAAAVVATSMAACWPWRLIEAMELGVPIVAVDSGVHRDVVADGGALVPPGELSDALIDALGSGRERLRVLGSDRARAFSWASSAERVWALHAEL